MAGFPNFSSTPVQNLVGAVQSIAGNQNPDGTLANVALDRSGALVMASKGGRYSAAANRTSGGNIFLTSTLAAGVTIPVTATTLASTAGIWNPVGSGVNVELIMVAIQSHTIEVVLDPFQIEFQLNASTAGGSPTSVTKLSSLVMPLSSGSGVSKASAYSAATLTNAAALVGKMPLFGNLQTVASFANQAWYFNGEVVMGPDTVMALTNSTATLAGVNVTYVWAEWLP